jgi:hypothetical protein
MGGEVMRYRRTSRVLLVLAMILSTTVVAGCSTTAPDIWFTVQHDAMHGSALDTVKAWAFDVGKDGETVTVAVHAKSKGGVKNLHLRIADQGAGFPRDYWWNPPWFAPPSPPSGGWPTQEDLSHDTDGTLIQFPFSTSHAAVRITGEATSGDGQLSSVAAYLDTQLNKPQVFVTATCQIGCDFSNDIHVAGIDFVCPGTMVTNGPQGQNSGILCAHFGATYSLDLYWQAYNCDSAQWCDVEIWRYFSTTSDPSAAMAGPGAGVTKTPLDGTVYSNYYRTIDVVNNTDALWTYEFYVVRVTTQFGVGTDYVGVRMSVRY